MSTQTEEQLNKEISRLKSAGFIGQLSGMGKTKEYIKKAHARYIKLDAARYEQRNQKYAGLRQVILNGVKA